MNRTDRDNSHPAESTGLNLAASEGGMQPQPAPSPDSPKTDTIPKKESKPVRPSDRRAKPRFEVTARASLVLFADSRTADGKSSGKEEVRVRVAKEGHTRDLSVNGACIEFEGKINSFSLQQFVGRRVKLRLELLAEGETELNIIGTVAWAQELRDACRVGIQFAEVLPWQVKALERVCQRDEGAQNRIAHLWELLVAEPKPAEPTERPA